VYRDNRVQKEKTEGELSYGLQAAREETLIFSALLLVLGKRRSRQQ
jgi:hypothetical protein